MGSETLLKDCVNELVKALAPDLKLLVDDPRRIIVGRHVYLPDYTEGLANELEARVAVALRLASDQYIQVTITKSASPGHVNAMIATHLTLERRVTL